MLRPPIASPLEIKLALLGWWLSYGLFNGLQPSVKILHVQLNHPNGINLNQTVDGNATQMHSF